MAVIKMQDSGGNWVPISYAIGFGDGSGSSVTWTNPATTSDVIKGKEFINDTGKKLVGTLDVSGLETIPFLSLTATEVQNYSEGFRTSVKSNRNGIINTETDIRTYINKNQFGDATVNDVKEGKTFTSQNGLKMTGVLSNASGFHVAGETTLFVGSSGTINIEPITKLATNGFFIYVIRDPMGDFTGARCCSFKYEEMDTFPFVYYNYDLSNDDIFSYKPKIYTLSDFTNWDISIDLGAEERTLDVKYVVW